MAWTFAHEAISDDSNCAELRVFRDESNFGVENSEERGLGDKGGREEMIDNRDAPPSSFRFLDLPGFEASGNSIICISLVSS